MTNEPKDNPDKVGYCQCDWCKTIRNALAEGREQALKEVEELINRLRKPHHNLYQGKQYNDLADELKQAIDQLRNKEE